MNEVPLTSLTKEEYQALEGKEHGDTVQHKGEDHILRYSLTQEGWYLRPKEYHELSVGKNHIDLTDYSDPKVMEHLHG